MEFTEDAYWVQYSADIKNRRRLTLLCTVDLRAHVVTTIDSDVDVGKMDTAADNRYATTARSETASAHVVPNRGRDVSVSVAPIDAARSYIPGMPQ